MTGTPTHTPPEFICTEDWDVGWVPGHITDRDERRRVVEHLLGEMGGGVDEWTFLERVQIAREATLVWMRHWSDTPQDDPDYQPPDWADGEWWNECAETAENTHPMTRIDFAR